MTAKPVSLDLVQIASPCQVNWDDMTGDDRVRHCRHCKLNVYDLSAMQREEAEAFLQSREGRTCIRLYRRHDGTVLTRDCPVGLRAAKQRFVRAVAALAGVLLALVTGTLFGSRLNRLKPAGFRAPATAFAEWIEPGSTEQYTFSMGAWACPPSLPVYPYPGSTPESEAEPAETPFPEPTAEQLEQIQERLTE
jgi:hypothetical protein